MSSPALGARVVLVGRDARTAGGRARRARRRATARTASRWSWRTWRSLASVRAADGADPGLGAAPGRPHRQRGRDLPRADRSGPDGIEATMATMVVGPFALVGGLLPLLRRTGDARVIAVTSGGQYAQRPRPRRPGVNRKGDYDGTRAYARAKRAQVSAHPGMGATSRGRAVSAFDSMHPGWARHARPVGGPARLRPADGSAPPDAGRGDRHDGLAGDDPPSRRRQVGSLVARPTARGRSIGVPMTRLTASRSPTPVGPGRGLSGLPDPAPDHRPSRTQMHRRQHDHAPRTDRDDPAHRRRRSPTSPTSRTPRSGIRASRPPSDSTPAPSASGRAIASASGCGGRVAPMEYRISVFEPPTRVVLVGAGSGVSAVDDIRFERIAAGHARRLHGRHPARGLPAGSSSRSSVAPSRTSAATPSAACSGPSTPARPTRDSRATGRRGMKVAIVGAGVSGLTRGLRPAPTSTTIRLFDARCRPSGATSRRSPSRREHGPVAVDTGFIVYNEHTYPTFVRLLAELGVETQPSDMSLGSTCRACDVEFSSRGVRGYLAHAGVGRPARPLADDGRHPAVLPRGPARRSTAPAPSTATLGEFLDDGGYGAGLPPPLPRPDHLGRLVDRRRAGSSTSRSTTCCASSTTTA